MTRISFIYFDVGGVAIQDFSDTKKWDMMIDQALGIPQNSRVAFDQLYDEYEDDICKGKIAVDDLQPFIKEHFHADIPTDFSMLSYFVGHFEPNPGIWEIVKHLTSTIQFGLLTDQYLGMLDLIFAHQLIPQLPFKAIVDSSVLGMRKPMPEIYQIAQERTGVPASEILFIDNREKNLVVPRQMGWQTYFYDSKDYEKSNKLLAQFFSENI